MYYLLFFLELEALDDLRDLLPEVPQMQGVIRGGRDERSLVDEKLEMENCCRPGRTVHVVSHVDVDSGLSQSDGRR